MNPEAMQDILEQRKKIESRIFDPSQLISRNEAEWAKAPLAVKLEELPLEVSVQLFPASTRIERAAGAENQTSTVIGGVCSVYTEDIPQVRRGDQTPLHVVRLDQVVEAAGLVKDKPVLAVIEDSQFAELLKVDKRILQAQAEEFRKRIERWMKLSLGSTDLTLVYTSEIDKDLNEAVAQLTNLVENPAFAGLQSAPILVMYTALWSELLQSKDYLDSDQVICIEPVAHFVADEKKFPNQRQRSAFRDYLEWLRDQPYGHPGSRNQNFSIAGFTSTVSNDQKKQRTRILPYSKVPNTSNVKGWIENLAVQKSEFPFPLRSSQIAAEALNWGMWNEEILARLEALVDLELDYYDQRKALESREQSNQLKSRFQRTARPYLSALIGQLSNILFSVLGD